MRPTQSHRANQRESSFWNLEPRNPRLSPLSGLPHQRAHSTRTVHLPGTRRGWVSWEIHSQDPGPRRKTQGVGRRYPDVREPGERPASMRQGLYLSSGSWACLAIWPSSLPVAKQGQERVPRELPWQRDTRAVRQRKEGLFHTWESPGAWVRAGRQELLGLQHPQTLQQRLGTEQKFLTGDSSWNREKLLQMFSSAEIPGPSNGLRPCFSNCNWHW